jgi:hypothetical protein
MLSLISLFFRLQIKIKFKYNFVETDISHNHGPNKKRSNKYFGALVFSNLLFE